VAINRTLESKNKTLVLEAFDTLFNKRDYAAAEKFWSPRYIQHSAHIAPGRKGLFDLIQSLPPTLRYEAGTIVAEGNFVIVHGRFSNFGLPENWIAADIVRIENGRLVEHWDVIEDEGTKQESKSGLPMFGEEFSKPNRATSRTGPKIVMLEKRKISTDAETDRCVQLASGFLIRAEKELSAFINAVDKLFGAEQARQSGLDWIEELERMDWPSGESIPDWRRATVGASARLGVFLSGSGQLKLGRLL
jgi:predicted SnoaL-like aldol condensation-catalyzing enzyme